jgi:uncharacterized integral membrane protein
MREAPVRKFLWLLLAVLTALVIVPFGLANRAPIAVSVDPFGRATAGLTFEAPLALILFLVFMAGLLLGGLAMWLSQSRWRRTARVRTREAFRWRAEASRLTRDRDTGTEKAIAAGRRAA